MAHQAQAIVNLGNCAFGIGEALKLAHLPLLARLKRADVVLRGREILRERDVVMNHARELNADEAEDDEGDKGSADAAEETKNKRCPRRSLHRLVPITSRRSVSHAPIFRYF